MAQFSHLLKLYGNNSSTFILLLRGFSELVYGRCLEQCLTHYNYSISVGYYYFYHRGHDYHHYFSRIRLDSPVPQKR